MSNSASSVGFILMLAIVGLSARSAEAGIVPIYQSTTPAAASFRWSYAAIVGEHERIAPGDFFTIYDFAGSDGSHSEPADWDFSAPVLGSGFGLALANDDPTLVNLTWQYAGTVPIIGPALLGVFAADSLVQNFGSDNFLGIATGDGGRLEGRSIAAFGVITVPISVAAPLPDPAAIALPVIAALLVFSTRRGRPGNP